MQINVRQAGNASVVEVSGDIDLYNSPDLRTKLLEALKEKGRAHVILNLTRVRYIDSSGIASLVEGLKVSRTQNVRFTLVGLSPAAREVLELSRLIKVFEVFPTEEEALKT